MIDYDYGLAGYIITLISLIHGSTACVVSFVVVIVIFWQLYHHRNRMKQEDQIILLIHANVYFFMTTYLMTLVLFNVQPLIGDVYGKDFNSSWCTIHGFLYFITACGLFQGFVVQVREVVF